MSAETLAVRAAKLANGDSAPRTQAPVPSAAGLAAQTDPDDGLREGEYPEYAQVPVHIAWLRVRHDVKAISKGEQFIEGYGANAKVKYTFRGADTVVKAYSPVTLRHGVNVLPVTVADTHRDISSKAGNRMSECTVRITWEITGPMGDKMTAQTVGEAIDTSDKASTKAQTVALRVLLLGGGLIPTGDADPDAQYIERGEDTAPQANAYLAEITDPSTSAERFRQIYHELDKHRLVPTVVEFEGQRLSLGALYLRVRGERWPKPTAAEMRENVKADSPQQQPLTALAHTGPHDESGYSPQCDACAAEQAYEDQQAAGGAR